MSLEHDGKLKLNSKFKQQILREKNVNSIHEQTFTVSIPLSNPSLNL